MATDCGMRRANFFLGFSSFMVITDKHYYYVIMNDTLSIAGNRFSNTINKLYTIVSDNYREAGNEYKFINYNIVT